MIPYDGPRSTKRRPIYIECLADKVILHPEGVVLTDQDFLVPSDVGNPLAAALRATREYIAEQARTASEEDPYPLILVRPGGTDSYYAVRRAMKGWGPEFGYELIDDDWEMEYPAADPNLAQTQYRAIEEARMRQKALVTSIKRKMIRRRYTPASGRGPLIEEGAGGGHGTGHGTGNDPLRPFGSYRETAGGTGNYGGPDSGGPNHQDGNRYESVQHNQGARAGGNNRPAQGNQPGGNQPGGNQFGGNQPDGKHRNHSAENPGGQNGPSPHRGPQVAGNGGPANQQQGPRDGGQIGHGQAGGPEGGQPGGSSASISVGSPSAGQSLASKRGKNWGVKSVIRSSIGITRPVRISCYDDRLVVRSDESTHRGKVITLGPDVQKSIDEFVAATWQQTKTWGIAGKGMHWKPVLLFQVEPGGESRFQELSALLKNSGLQVRRAQGQSPESRQAGRGRTSY